VCQKGEKEKEKEVERIEREKRERGKKERRRERRRERRERERKRERKMIQVQVLGEFTPNGSKFMKKGGIGSQSLLLPTSRSKVNIHGVGVAVGSESYSYGGDGSVKLGNTNNVTSNSKEWYELVDGKYPSLKLTYHLFG
jgi:hypothetical protein